jgi:hypothetical protein
MTGGVCPYCCEELFILRFQADDDPGEHSREFVAKAQQQADRISSRHAAARASLPKGSAT